MSAPYGAELRVHWRALAGAAMGLGSGLAILMYVTTIMGPALLAEFHWTKAQFAWVSGLTVLNVVCIPLAGRLADTLGVRRTAAIGVVGLPVTLLAASFLSGDIRQFAAITLVQSMLCVTTTATVYTRAVVEAFVRARGLALAIVASGPALTGAIGGPLLNRLVQEEGWRAGYQALALFCAVAGVLSLLLIGSTRAAASPDGDGQVAAAPRPVRAVYREIFANRNFRLLIVAVLLCNLPMVIMLGQLKLLLLDNGLSDQQATLTLSAFAIGVLIGRFLCGAALDWLPANLVAALALGLPAIGHFLVAGGPDTPLVLTVATILMGLAIGAEGDVLGYLVSRIAGLTMFSSMLGLVMATIALASAIGSAVLGVTLAATGGYAAFLTLCGVTTLGGSLLFLFVRSGPQPAATTAAAPPRAATAD